MKTVKIDFIRQQNDTEVQYWLPHGLAVQAILTLKT